LGFWDCAKGPGLDRAMAWLSIGSEHPWLGRNLIVSLWSKRAEASAGSSVDDGYAGERACGLQNSQIPMHLANPHAILLTCCGETMQTRMLQWAYDSSRFPVFRLIGPVL